MESYRRPYNNDRGWWDTERYKMANGKSEHNINDGTANEKMSNQQNKYNDDTDSVASLDSTGKRKSFRRLCERFAEKTSMQGIPYIHMAKLAWAKLIWTLLLLGALAGMIYHLKFLIATYVLFEKSTKIELGHDKLPFPAVTICNTNIIKQSLLEELEGAEMLKELVHDLKPDNLAKDQSPGGNTGTNEGGTTGTNQGGNTRPNQGGETGTNGSGQNPPPRVRRQQPTPNNNNNNNNYEPPPEYRPPLHNFNVSKYDPDFNDALDDIDFDEDEYEDEYPIDAQAEAYDLFTELYMDLTKKERAQIGHNISEMLVSCSFGQRVCDHRQFHLYQTSEYGNCWTIKSTKFVSQRAGPSGGLQMVLFLNTKEYLAGITNGYGLRVLVHHGDTFPFPYDEGIFIPAAMETNIGLRLRTITRIGPPHGECNEGVEFKNKLKFTYTRQACQVSCIIFKVLETCGCFEDGTEEIALSQIQNARPCRSTKEQRCLIQLLRKFAKKEETCTCLNPCLEVVYEQAISQRQWPSDDYAKVLLDSACHLDETACGTLRSEEFRLLNYNFVKLNIYYADLNYENVTESPDIETSQFLSDVGGAIGLWIGLSLLSMCELGQLFVELFIYLVDRLRHGGERTERRRERQKNKKLKELSNPTNRTETNHSKGVIGIPDIKYDLDGSDRESSRDNRYDSRFRNSPHGGPHFGPLKGDKSPRDSPRGSPWLERRGREEFGMRPPTRFYHEY